MSKKSEWVLLGFDDPQKSYIGKIECDAFDTLSDGDIRDLIIDSLGKATFQLTEACQLTFIMQPTEGGMQLLPATIPLSGAQGPATIYIKPTTMMFAKDTPGLDVNVERLMAQFKEMTMVGRARSSGLVIPGRKNG